MNLPKQLGFRFSGETESSQPNQNNQLFFRTVYTADKIGQRQKFPVLRPFFEQLCNCILFQILHMNKACINGFTNNTGFAAAMVYARQFNGGTLPLGFVKIHPGAVKSAKVVDYRRLKFERIMGFQEKALETFDGIRSRMCFRKRVACKRFNLPPNFLTDRIRITQTPAITEILILNPLKLIPRS